MLVLYVSLMVVAVLYLLYVLMVVTVLYCMPGLKVFAYDIAGVTSGALFRAVAGAQRQLQVLGVASTAVMSAVDWVRFLMHCSCYHEQKLLHI